MVKFFKQVFAILNKNYTIHNRSLKKIIGFLLMPVLISIIIVVAESFRTYNIIISKVLEILLSIYLGLLCISFGKELIVQFITEREQHYRQYQNIMGLPLYTHMVGNLLYNFILMSICISPVYIILNYYHFSLLYILNFASFVISSLVMSLMISSMFSDHKIASQLVSLIFSLTSFLALVYNHEEKHLIDYIIISLPNTSFALGIINKSIRPSLISLGVSKIYMIIYLLIQYKWKCRNNKWLKVKSIKSQQANKLVQQIQIEMQSSSKSINKTQIIKIDNITKKYSDTVAVDQFSLKVNKSQIIGLLGRNGAGKTTLVDIITNVTEPTQGSIYIDTQYNNPIGICYQHQILYELMTIQQHFQFYASIKQANVNINQIIIALGIQSDSHKLIKELSGGTKRKVSIGIAILGNPQILIFDEPTSGLDPSSRRNVWEILSNLREKESTVILTSHHLDEIQYLADHICIMEKGKCVFEGTTTSIKQIYGRGYYLTINSQKPLINNIQSLQSIVRQHSKSQQVEKNQYSLKYFIKENISVTMIKQLEKIQNITISLEANTLQQSFMAILNDLQPHSIPNSLNFQQQLSPSSWGRIKAIIMRSIYNYKSKMLEKTIFYNINILIIVFTSIFNNLIVNKIQQQKQFKNDNNNNNNNNDMSLIQGYYIMALVYISLPVMEKEDKIMGVMKTRGLKGYQYWIGNFIFDYSLFIVNYLGVQWLSSMKLIGDLNTLLILLTGIGMILFAYAFSFMFDKLKTANNLFGIVNSLVGFIILPLILLGKGTVFQNLKPIKYFYPYYDLGLYTLKKNEGLSLLISQEPSTIYYCIIIYLLLITILQSSIFSRLKNMSALKTSAKQVRFNQVSKSYGNIQALDHITFECDHERLALLGHNGAGKSTTFDLLTCQISTDQGEVYVEGQQKRIYNNTLSSVGICYQTNAVWQSLTTHQILSVFCDLVGVSDKELQISWLYDNLQFQYSNKRFQNLSGGNKRKVCMAVALLGNPNIRLLDQCSTGLDPSSRFSMVRTIKKNIDGLTIFTTHSMPQAEDLCQKIMIMKKGKIIELEMNYQLKAKYYNCYWVIVNFDEQINQMNREITLEQLRIPVHHKILRSTKTSIVIEIQKDTLKLSKLFQHLTSIEKDGTIKSFQISQPKLQDVYLQITGPQQNI